MSKGLTRIVACLVVSCLFMGEAQAYNHGTAGSLIAGDAPPVCFQRQAISCPGTAWRPEIAGRVWMTLLQILPHRSLPTMLANAALLLNLMTPGFLLGQHSATTHPSAVTITAIHDMAEKEIEIIFYVDKQEDIRQLRDARNSRELSLAQEAKRYLEDKKAHMPYEVFIFFCNFIPASLAMPDNTQAGGLAFPLQYRRDPKGELQRGMGLVLTESSDLRTDLLPHEVVHLQDYWALTDVRPQIVKEILSKVSPEVREQPGVADVVHDEVGIALVAQDEQKALLNTRGMNMTPEEKEYLINNGALINNAVSHIFTRVQSGIDKKQQKPFKKWLEKTLSNPLPHPQRGATLLPFHPNPLDRHDANVLYAA